MISRRRFLRGVGGAMVALPALESVVFPRRASAEEPRRVYSLFLVQANGCHQPWFGEESDTFWPRQPGPLTRSVLSVDNADRTAAELAPYADRLLMVRGTKYGFDDPAVSSHGAGIAQCLTAAGTIKVGDPAADDVRATGESIDWFIARRLNPRPGGPLTLASGPADMKAVSYEGPMAPRASSNNPFSVYQSLVGLTGASRATLEAIASRRRSVNDLVRDELTALTARRELSAADRRRLSTHFEAIRDFEVNLSCTLDAGQVSTLQGLSATAAANENRLPVARLMLDLAAWAFSCDLNRVATVQVGGSGDSTRYFVDGAYQNAYHRISHRVDSDGDTGAPIPNAQALHHRIDVLFAQLFRHLLDRLASYPGPSGGTLLDDAVAVWTNELATGPRHGNFNLPLVVAGRAGGALATGQFFDAGPFPFVTHNQFLNALINAVGIRNPDGSRYDRFGHQSLPRGVLARMLV